MIFRLRFRCDRASSSGQLDSKVGAGAVLATFWINFPQGPIASPQWEQLMAVALWTSTMTNSLVDPQCGQLRDNAVITQLHRQFGGRGNSFRRSIVEKELTIQGENVAEAGTVSPVGN